MTWTLRLYDESGDELAWVNIIDEKAYSYDLAEPNRNLDVILHDSQWVYSDPPRDTLDRAENVHFEEDPAQIDGELTPKEHLEHIREDVSSLPAVARTELNDE